MNAVRPLLRELEAIGAAVWGPGILNGVTPRQWAILRVDRVLEGDERDVTPDEADRIRQAAEEILGPREGGS